MANYLDSDKLASIFKDFYEVTNIRIAILNTDYRDINGYPKEKAPLCQYIRSCQEADLKCRECDKAACKAARESSEPYMYRCHAGLYEIIQPLIINDVIVGYLFFAHMLCGDKDKDKALQTILDSTKGFDLDPNVIKGHVERMKLMSSSYIIAASRLLCTIATYICLENLGFVKKGDNLPILINQYIYEHLGEPISIEQICEEFGIGKTKLSELSQNLFGTSIHAHITEMRIEKAKELLLNNLDIAVWEVAEQCGFANYDYFISLFKKVVGMPPKQYIKANKGKAAPSQSLIPL